MSERTELSERPEPAAGLSRRGALAAVGAAVGVGVLAACSSPAGSAADGPTSSGSASPATTSDGAPTGMTQPAGTTVGSDFDVDQLVSVPAGGAVPAGFAVSRYLVTNAQYATFLEATGRAAPSAWPDGSFFAGKDDHPVLYVSAVDAEAYCAWLGGRHDGWTFALPSQEQWQAVAGAAGGDWPWGTAAAATYRDGALDSRMNYNGVLVARLLAEHGNDLVTYTDRSSKAGSQVRLSELVSISADGGVRGWIDHATNTGLVFTDLYADVVAAGGSTSPVGSYPTGATGTGICDLAGNAWEWTSSTVDATNGAEKGTAVRAVRGGSWYATSRSCTTTYTGEGRAPDGGFNSIGFRVTAVRR